MALRIGIEIETVDVDYTQVYHALKPVVRDNIEIAPKTGPVPFWAVTYDPSLHARHNCELKTPVNPKVGELWAVLAAMKTLGCRVNRYCGMHVHVSDPDAPWLRINLPKIRVWRQREPYAQKIPGAGRDGVAQRAANHLEVRVFNSSLDPLRVIRNVRLVKACLIRPDTPVPALQNRVFPSPVENDWELVVS